MEQDYEEFKENQKKRGFASKIQRSFFQDIEVGDQTTSYVGLVNEGTTCFVNSMLQTLFSLGQFRTSIYRLPSLSVEEVDSKRTVFVEKDLILCM